MKKSSIAGRWSFVLLFLIVLTTTAITACQSEELEKVTASELSLYDLSELNFSHRDLSGLVLVDKQLRGADFTSANLTRANLVRSDLSDAQLYNAKLFNTDLSHANLSGANLKYANMRNANLTGANLRGANLDWANLTGAIVIDEQLATAVLRGCTQMPRGTFYGVCYNVPPPP
jgi:uncharacterized protein YjbI with pentapeptide repeats